MDLYANSLLRNIGKVFILPRQNTTAYKQLQTQLFNIMNQLKSGQIDRQGATNALNVILSNMKRSPPRAGRNEERISTIVELLAPRNLAPKTILDVGAGSGDIITSLKNYYNLPAENVFAIDQKLPNVVDVTPLTYIDGKIPLPDNSMDLIIMFVVLHHIPPEFRDNILSEVSRVLSPNGVFIIREHDNDGTVDFYIFLDMIHIFWYIASNETPDPLYLLSRAETQGLLAKVGLSPDVYITYPEPNPQRLYHELFVKKIGAYKFKDAAAQVAIQTYINKFLRSPRTYESLVSLVPNSLLPGIIEKYQNNITPNWNNISKDITLAIILSAVKYAPIINGIHYISAENINTVLAG